MPRDRNSSFDPVTRSCLGGGTDRRDRDQGSCQLAPGDRANLCGAPGPWNDKYPAMIRSWENTWDEFVPFLAFPVEQAATKVLYLIAIR